MCADTLGNLAAGACHPSAVAAAFATLREVGALTADESLTPLGYHLAALPVDVRVGKMMLFGPWPNLLLHATAANWAAQKYCRFWRRCPFQAPSSAA